MKYSTNSKYEQLSKRTSGSLIDDESLGSPGSQSGKVNIFYFDILDRIIIRGFVTLISEF